jgi:beta-lactamase superfamily II metal-dependent hydrolase
MAKNTVASLRRMIPNIRVAHRSDHIQADGFRAEVLWPPEGFISKRIENDWSLALRIEFGGRSFLVAGDLPKRFENQINTSPVDVLKLSHHGSRTSTSALFLKSLRPRMCIVSAGTGHYNHPHRETELRVKEAGCVELQTKFLGDIKMEATGGPELQTGVSDF